MDNYCRLNKSDMIEIKNDIDNQELGKIKNLSQAERRVLKVAIESLNSGSSSVIISQNTGRKLTEASNYDKNMCKSISKALDKFFHPDDYIDFNELSNSINAMQLDAVDLKKPEEKLKRHEMEPMSLITENKLFSLEKAESFKLEIEKHENKAKEYEARAIKYEAKAMKLEEEVKRLEEMLERLDRADREESI